MGLALTPPLQEALDAGLAERKISLGGGASTHAYSDSDDDRLRLGLGWLPGPLCQWGARLWQGRARRRPACQCDLRRLWCAHRHAALRHVRRLPGVSGADLSDPVG